jgi:hypothetical protein
LILGVHYTIKNLDHLGLVAGMIDELEIENEINKLIPTNEKKKTTFLRDAVQSDDP